MKQFEVVTPVIVALDGATMERNLEVQGLVTREFSPEEIMFKLSHGSVRHWDELTARAQEGGFGVIWDTRYGDKIANNIHQHFDDGELDYYPDAITAHPPRVYASKEEENDLRSEVSRLGSSSHPSGGIAVFGFTYTDQFHFTDGDLMGPDASAGLSRACDLGFAAIEVLYPGLKHFFHSSRANIGNEKIIVSKLSIAGPNDSEQLLQAAEGVYETGAHAIQLGSSVSGEHASAPDEVVKTVLRAYDRSLAELKA